MKLKELPPVEVLRELLDYNQESGVVTYTKSAGSRKKGDVAGTPRRGYLTLKVGGETYSLHRLIWMMFYGEDPGDYEIDHIDRNKSNNRIDNLRLVDRSQNCFNCDRTNKNKSGHIGVSYNKRDKLWCAKIGKKGLGYYKTKEDAITARLNAEREHNIVGMRPL
jgi:hypothetical protein